MKKEPPHRSVLLQEVVEGLDAHCGEWVVDATLGAGGHSGAICAVLKGDVHLIGIDADESALTLARKNLEVAGCADATLVRENFRNLGGVLAGLGVEEVHRVLFDLGLSSMQLSPPAGGSGKGFSFLRDEPLVMTFGKETDTTAKEVVNHWEEKNLIAILEGFGEERYAKKIAHAIVEARGNQEIDTTRKLVEVIESSVPPSYKRGRLHPATKTFQALRMAVNDELGALEEGLNVAFARLAGEGRIAVISFHSVEDRVVKRLFRKWEERGKGKRITKKPIVPERAEVIENPRARSAKLRIIEKHATIQN